ncbi:TadE/TadG family type IV pilus assembly protein [Microbacterium bovistercoris]|nr:TadE/TadG family type IV pilus assembly protein [Microbacterium bovistercoris]
MTWTRNERGAAAVEFAFIMLPLMLIVLGIIQFGLLFNAQVSVSNAAREAARVMAIQEGEDGAEGNAQDAAVSAFVPVIGPDLSRDQVQLTVGATEQEPCVVTADVKYHAELLFPGFLKLLGGASTLTLTGSGQMVCGG